MEEEKRSSAQQRSCHSKHLRLASAAAGCRLPTDLLLTVERLLLAELRLSVNGRLPTSKKSRKRLFRILMSRRPEARRDGAAGSLVTTRRIAGFLVMDYRFHQLRVGRRGDA
jgi:hypothetical protein